MRRAIILGADGFLGRNLIRRLDELGGWSVHGVGRDAGDLTDPETADRAFAAAPESDVIFHAVTRQRTGQVQYGIQGEMLAMNGRIHLYALEAWRRRQPQAKLLSMGSSCAYPESDLPLTEAMFGTGRAHPSVTGYALAKQVLATGAQTYAEQYGMKHLHCILATMYGPEDHKAPDRSHFVGAMLERAAAEKMKGGTAFEVWGDPRTVREVLYVDDQIDAVLAADAHFENRILNTAAQTPVTVEETAKRVLEALEWEAELVTSPNSFAGAAFKLLDSSDFLQATGWTPRLTLAQGLRRLAELEYSDAL
jgi:nucleoside-diphosphate-sugar epimerase